jgi:hypothetical protein
MKYMSHFYIVNPNFLSMPHTVESTINYSAADYARGAVDLLDEEPTTMPPVLINTTVVDKAATLVREVAPRVIETIVSHLMPVSPSSPGPGTTQPDPVPQQQYQQHPQQHQTLISPPVETVVIVEVPSNFSTSTPIQPVDTVCNKNGKSAHSVRFNNYIIFSTCQLSALLQ